MIEFALIVPLVLALVLGVVEVALVARSQLLVINAAREGAREAAANPDPADAVVAARAVLGDRGALTRVSVQRPMVVGKAARVRVVMPYRVAAPFFGGLSVELSSTAAMRVER